MSRWVPIAERCSTRSRGSRDQNKSRGIGNCGLIAGEPHKLGLRSSDSALGAYLTFGAYLSQHHDYRIFGVIVGATVCVCLLMSAAVA